MIPHRLVLEVKTKIETAMSHGRRDGNLLHALRLLDKASLTEADIKQIQSDIAAAMYAGMHDFNLDDSLGILEYMGQLA